MMREQIRAFVGCSFEQTAVIMQQACRDNCILLAVEPGQRCALQTVLAFGKIFTI